MTFTIGPLGAVNPLITQLGSGVYNSTPPSPATGQAVALQVDSQGNLLVNTEGSGAAATIGSQTTQITSSSSETTIVSAGAAGIYNDILGFQITNQSATAVTVTIKDSTSGTTRKVYDLAANGGIVVHFDPPLPQSGANANWTATLSVNTVTVDVNVDFIATTQAGV